MKWLFFALFITIGKFAIANDFTIIILDSVTNNPIRDAYVDCNALSNEGRLSFSDSLGIARISSCTPFSDSFFLAIFAHGYDLKRMRMSQKEISDKIFVVYLSPVYYGPKRKCRLRKRKVFDYIGE